MSGLHPLRVASTGRAGGEMWLEKAFTSQEGCSKPEVGCVPCGLLLALPPFPGPCEKGEDSISPLLY